MELVEPLASTAADAATHEGFLRAGSGQPLVLLHGVTGSCNVWRRVLPLLTPFHDVIAPTALGHRGGVSASARPVRIQHVIDDAERWLDRLGLDRVHLAGNSMGGWVALELARRGRARSVCALSPAGAWTSPDRLKAQRKLARAIAGARSTQALIPLLAFSRRFRRWALRDNAVRGDRLSRADLLEVIDDLVACEACDDLLRTTEELLPLAADCPITLAWSSEDRIFPLHVNGARARTLVPHAMFVVLEGIGHVAMFDDPQLVAATILRTIERSQSYLS